MAPLPEFIAQLQSLSTGLCVDVTNQSTASGANADTAACIDNAANQSLYFFPVSDIADTYTIEVEHSGLCLTVPNNSNSNGASIQQQNCNNSNAQQFRVIDEGSRTVIFTGTGNRQLVLDSHAQTDDLIHWRDFGNNNQRWRFINRQAGSSPAAPDTAPVQPVTPAPAPIPPAAPTPDPVQPVAPAPTPVQPLVPAPAPVQPVAPAPVPVQPVVPLPEFIAQLQSLSTGLCVDVTNQSTASGANADTAACIDNAANQSLYFFPVSGLANTYTIEVEHSGLCLTVPNNSTSNGASIQQQNCNNSNAQQFRVIDEGSRTVIFTGTGNRQLVLDSHAQTDDLIHWEDFGNNNQRWRFINRQD